MISKSSASLLFLCTLISIAVKDSSTCEITGVVGTSVTIELKAKVQFNDNDDLRWKHKDTNVFRKRDGKVTTKIKNIKSDGSLEIDNVKMVDEGEYFFESFGSDGKLKHKQSTKLCVQEKLPKPTANVTCTKGVRSINCINKGSTTLTFKWFENDKEMENKNSATLSHVNAKKNYACAVKNSVQEARSDTVTPTNTECSLAQDLLWGFDRWIMISILAGGGGLVLLLMIVLIICACQSCKRREKHLQDEEEFRLNFHNTPHSGQQRSKHTARGQPAPPIPQEDPEVSNYEVDEPPPKTQPRSKKSPRPPPPPVDDDEQPPPLPQPRKNAPHGKKNQGPLYLQP